jgi:hypothetical protein
VDDNTRLKENLSTVLPPDLIKQVLQLPFPKNSLVNIPSP